MMLGLFVAVFVVPCSDIVNKATLTRPLTPTGLNVCAVGLRLTGNVQNGQIPGG